MDEIRAQLSQLMGELEAPGGLYVGKDFRDRDVCKLYLTGLCPHDLFDNTKHYLGPCSKIHAEELRAEYEKVKLTKNYGYEEEALAFISPMIHDCDRKITKAKMRVSSEEDPTKNPLDVLVMEELRAIDVHIQQKMLKAEELGLQGLVDDSLRVMEEIERLKHLKVKTLDRNGDSNYAQKLKPCEICGALLSASDSDRRLSEHFSGKIHVGFQKLRDAVRTLNELIAQKSELPREAGPQYHDSPDRIETTRSRSKSYDEATANSNRGIDSRHDNYGGRDCYGRDRYVRGSYGRDRYDRDRHHRDRSRSHERNGSRPHTHRSRSSRDRSSSRHRDKQSSSRSHSRR
ncbi:LUC7 N_terminus [Babesia microti strain RI]|uniref:LUC7 N_terminus n=1 Tax=Babesia microti (strain RI) TaxID=1133968 RepID=A0A1N6LX35_BABMR|nr:LUC7 N_terminus [Babesia microti strain RI]SIO73438.1 LUC7 N_terminus [Babesia microti strain RI]|eukprot:XP_012647673.2 LUC7 N_terminus [Babesia microti strain RI]